MAVGPDRNPGGSDNQSRESLLSITKSGRPENKLKSYSPSQLFPLMRLSFLQRRKGEVINVLGNGDWRMRLLNKAMYSVYQDCVSAGVSGEARLLLGQHSPAN